MVNLAPYGVPFVSKLSNQLMCILWRCMAKGAAIRYNNACSDGNKSFTATNAIHGDKIHSDDLFDSDNFWR